MRSSNWVSIILTSFFSINLPVLADEGQSLGPIIPTCQFIESEPTPLDFCQDNCYFVPSTITHYYPEWAGALFCNVPRGSHLWNFRRYFEACRKVCFQPGSQLDQRTRLYIGQSEIADLERAPALPSIKVDGSELAQNPPQPTPSYNWPFCTSASQCLDAVLQPLGFVARCVIDNFQSAAKCAVSAALINRMAGNPVDVQGRFTGVVVYVSGLLAGVRNSYSAIMRRLGRGRPNRLGGSGNGPGDYSRLGGRSVLSDEETKEQDDEAKMWAERICACNATYTSNGCCFSDNGLVLEDPLSNQGPLTTP
jgi:hypothetical protein